MVTQKILFETLLSDLTNVFEVSSNMLALGVSFNTYFVLVYVVVSYYFEHLGFILSLQEKGLLNGDYFVVGVDIEHYNNAEPERYFKGLYNIKNDHCLL